jgi:hypothetical protein
MIPATDKPDTTERIENVRREKTMTRTFTLAITLLNRNLRGLTATGEPQPDALA